MYKASDKQVKLLVKLNKELKMSTSKKTFKSFTSQQASDRIQELLLMKKLGIDPSAINWKSEAAKAIRDHQKNAAQVLAGETYRARKH